MSSLIVSQPHEEEGEGVGQKMERPQRAINEDTTKTKRKGNIDYPEELRSRFGEAFLPYASKLESVEANRIKRKRKGKNKKKQPLRITNIPRYITGKENKIEQYNQHRSGNESKIRGKNSTTNDSRKYDKKLNWVGDTMIFDEEWPNTDKRSTLRLYHINLNGITYQNELLEWDMTIAYLMDMQVDVFGLTEMNLDLNNGIVKDNVLQCGRHFDPYLRMATSSSLQKVGDSPFKMGGTITGTNGCWSGRIKYQGSDKLGRWSYISLEARKGNLITVITVYLPRKPSKEGMGTTIYQQMQADLLQHKGKLLDPREELLNDLHTFIKKERNKGNLIFLMGDMNDDLGVKKGQMRTYLRSLGMRMTFIAKHGEEEKLPATHDRGKSCLDMIGCSENIDDSAIVRAGYAPFYFNFFTDHRGVFIDIDIESIFQCTRPDTTRHIYKRFTTGQIPKCSRYLKKLEDSMEKVKIFSKVQELEVKYHEYMIDKNSHDREDLIKKTQNLSGKVTELMKCAERQAGPLPYKDGFPDSPDLRRAAFLVIRLKKYLRLTSLGIIQHEDEDRKKVLQDLRDSQLELRRIQKSAHEIRQVHLERLADKRSHQWQMSSSEALHIIKESEKVKKLHSKHRRLLGQNNEGTLRSLMVPAPVTGLRNNVKDKRLYTRINDSKLMFNFLLKRNFRHLMQSDNSMFTQGPVKDMCGWYGEGEGMEDLLRGTVDIDNISKDYPQYGKEGAEFLKALRHVRNKDGKIVETFNWTFGVEEYLAVFNKTKETTACGPSGLHMSHWKAACERREIAKVHAFFMWAAFELGFTYTRWEQSWHCMIKKLKDPLLPKLRIVQLFEGDFNAGLKYLIGKKMMKHMNKNNIHDPETFGSRSGKTAPEAMVNLQLLFDHQRTWRLPVAILFNDAIGCYDRIVPTLCEIAMRARGCPKGIAQCHTKTQKGMIHRIRIATGISEGIIKFSLTNLQIVVDKTILCIQGKTGGIGQGGGAGPLAWIAVIDVMLEAYRKLNKGVEALDPLQLYSIFYWLISYVDDNTIVVSFGESESQTNILKTIRSNLGSWRRILQLTGGDIDVEKSKWSTMRWKHCKTWGTAKLETIKEFPGKVGMIDNHNGIQTTKVLGRLEPDKAERVLGIRLPMDGNMKDELKFRCQQIKKLSIRIYNAPLTHWDAWMIYESRYRSMIRYPLPVTLFTEKECIIIQKPFIHALLPKMGMNRNTPRSVVYGPKSLGGLELMDLRVEQITMQWEATRGHLRRLDRAGHGLYITAHDLQVEVGRSEPFYTLDPSEHDHITKRTRWKYLWESTMNLDLQIRINNFWTPSPKYTNDSNIMDKAHTDRVVLNSKWPLLYHINMCRIYLRAFTIGDLTKDGINIYLPYLNGTESGINDEILIPAIRRPTPNQWRIWKGFIFRTFLSPGTTINPKLGDKISNNDKKLLLPVSETDELLMMSNSDEIKDMIKLLPMALSTMVGETEIPKDGGLAMSEAIVDGRCIGASDGSLKRTFQHQQGSHGYALRETDRENDDLVGYGPSPKSDDMSSMTTEHFGLIGLLVILHLLCVKFSLCKEECYDTVVVYIDNKTVVDRSNKRQELINISDYSVPDQDLWALTTELIEKLPIALEIRWIKGHQDENMHGEKIHGPFYPDVQMNILVDRLASRGMNLEEDKQPRRPTFKNTAISVYTKDNVYITDIRKYITEKVNGNRLMEYYQRKRGWNKGTIESIEWEGLEGMLRNAKPIKRIKLVKLLHHWQNVGKQKGRIRDSRLKLDSEKPLLPTEEEKGCHLCPEGCGREEEELHYLTCSKEQPKESRKKLIKKTLKKMRSLRTSSPIMSMQGFILTSISNGTPIESREDANDMDSNSPLAKAMRGQEKIGWKAMCQGFLHKDWATTQREHYNTLGVNTRYLNIGRWKKMMSNILCEYSLECWALRNEKIHGKTAPESRTIKLTNLRKQVRSLYGKKDQIRREKNKAIFDMPLKKRLRLGIQSTKLWVGMAEEVLRMDRENATKNTIVHWLQHR